MLRARHLGFLAEDHLHVGQPFGVEPAARHRGRVAPAAGFAVAPVDELVVGELRVERHVEQAALAAGVHLRQAGQRGAGLAVEPDDAHPPRPFGDQQAAVGQEREPPRVLQPMRDGDDLDLERRRQRRRTGAARQRQHETDTPQPVHRHPCASTIICTRCRPWNSSRLEPVGEPHARRQRLDAAEPDRLAQRAAEAAARSFRCFSPTRRCDSTSTSSQNSGASKAWPQTCAVERRDRLGVEVLERAAGRRCAAVRVSVGGVEPFARPPAAAPPSKVVEVVVGRACSRPPSRGRRSAAARRDGAC